MISTSITTWQYLAMHAVSYANRKNHVGNDRCWNALPLFFSHTRAHKYSIIRDDLAPQNINKKNRIQRNNFLFACNPISHAPCDMKSRSYILRTYMESMRLLDINDIAAQPLLTRKRVWESYNAYLPRIVVSYASYVEIWKYDRLLSLVKFRIGA
jgi:hypothetical protein